MSIQNLKVASSADVDFLKMHFQHWHGTFRVELVDCFVSFHNAVIASGYIKYTVHRGDAGKFKRAGFTYKIGKHAAMCFDIDEKGLKFLFYRGPGRQPYANQKLVSFSHKDWSGYVYLTPTTFNEVCQCLEESAKILIKKYDNGIFIVVRGNTDVNISPPPPPLTPKASDIDERQSDRVETSIFRILRDTELSRRVKALHGSQCQICGNTITLKDGSSYAEAHHLQPLGEPHNGPDVEGNIICVCPNHHVELDYFASLLDLARIISIDGHTINQNYVNYHNQWHDKR